MTMNTSCNHSSSRLVLLPPVLLILATFTVHGVDAQTPLVSVRLCHVAYGIPFTTTAMAHADFTMQLLQPKYPNISFTYHPVANAGSTNIRQVARAVLNDGQRNKCDVLLGPTTSSLSVGINGVVNLPWISDTASSTELSNKGTYPWFSRVIPTDAETGVALAAMVREFGWTDVNVVCSDEPYGRSLATGFAEGMEAAGFKGLFMSCGPNTKEWALTVLKLVQKQRSRVVVVSSSNNFIITEAAMELGMNETHIFIFGEVACTDTSESAPIKRLPGAFCIQYQANQTAADAYLKEWNKHPAGMFAYLTEGYKLPQLPSEYVFSAFAALSSDMVRHVMHTLHTEFEAHNFNVTSFKPNNHWLRRVRIRDGVTEGGLTGPIAMDKNGDRKGANVGFFNVLPDGTKLNFAVWSNLTGVTQMPEMANGTSKLYWIDGTYSNTPMAQAVPTPAPTLPSFDNGETVPTLLLVVIFVAVCTVVLVLVLIFRVRSASKVAIKRLLRANFLFSVLKILAQVADCFTDGLAAYIVATRGGDSATFVGFYIALAALGILVGLVDVLLIVGNLFALIRAEGVLDADADHKWSTRLSRWGMVSLVVEDIPMGILAAVALSAEPDWLVIISLVVSAGFIGAKFKKIPDVLRSLTEESIDEKILDELEQNASVSIRFNAAAGNSMSIKTVGDGMHNGLNNPLEKKQSKQSDPSKASSNPTPGPHSPMSLPGKLIDFMPSAASFEPQSEHMQSITSNAYAITAQMIEERFPRRYDELLGISESIVRQCRRRKVGGREYSLVVAPHVYEHLVQQGNGNNLLATMARSNNSKSPTATAASSLRSKSPHPHHVAIVDAHHSSSSKNGHIEAPPESPSPHGDRSEGGATSKRLDRNEVDDFIKS